MLTIVICHNNGLIAILLPINRQQQEQPVVVYGARPCKFTVERVWSNLTTNLAACVIVS